MKLCDRLPKVSSTIDVTKESKKICRYDTAVRTVLDDIGLTAFLGCARRFTNHTYGFVAYLWRQMAIVGLIVYVARIDYRATIKDIIRRRLISTNVPCKLIEPPDFNGLDVKRSI
ncbi:hypothetical protein EVAR_43727_1 [Eumeta japonica]|uniref:Uncharacterized protein n=1 Tax=Eumeta variegata TaxID=151549 RepID=A0A4C1Y4L2_EUMVA|nr:hypothetical protein EVAR_43727_1 [Eumeta japonica]